MHKIIKKNKKAIHKGTNTIETHKHPCEFN